MSGYRLMSIHAHPDDEASKGAATTARYAAEGNDVLVVTCTGGERGSILNPAMDRPEIIENLMAVRRDEMAAAAEALGVEHVWLGYVDSGLPEGEPLPPLPEGCFALQDDEDVARDLIKLIREQRPHVILTYDENGGYPHPDHIKVHVTSMIAWDRAGDPEYAPELGEPWAPLKLYYSHGFIYQRILKMHRWLVDGGHESPFERMLERWGEQDADIMARVSTQVEAAEFFPHRDAALRAHATQIDPAGAFLAVPTEVQQTMWTTEEFELARTRVSTDLPETDLFAGIGDPSEADSSNHELHRK